MVLFVLICLFELYHFCFVLFCPYLLQIANIWSDICIDSAAKPGDMHSPIGTWPCHGQGGNQVYTENCVTVEGYTICAIRLHHILVKFAYSLLTIFLFACFSFMFLFIVSLVMV